MGTFFFVHVKPFNNIKCAVACKQKSFATKPIIAYSFFFFGWGCPILNFDILLWNFTLTAFFLFFLFFGLQFVQTSRHLLKEVGKFFLAAVGGGELESSSSSTIIILFDAACYSLMWCWDHSTLCDVVGSGVNKQSTHQVPPCRMAWMLCWCADRHPTFSLHSYQKLKP